MENQIQNQEPATQEERCRLLLVADIMSITPEQLDAAAGGGDIASLIVYARDAEAEDKQSRVEKLIETAHVHDIAVLIANDTQLVGRCGADGIFVDKGVADAENAIARFSPQNIVGCGNIKDRHRALETGEFWPDFLFFGKLAGDIKPDAHPKNVALAHWWADMIEIPCVVMGGSSMDSVAQCAESGAEFVALSKAIFDNGDPKANVMKANELLQLHSTLVPEVR